MALCEILYSGDLGDIRKALKRYLKSGENEDIFIDSFIKGQVPKLIRYTKTTIDASDAVLASIISFNEALDVAIEALVLKTPSAEASLRKLLLLVQTRLHIDLDESQSGSISESDGSIEAKTLAEVRDLNTSNLEAHLKEIYGTGAYDIIRTLKEKFDDATTAAGYWNINSGEVVLRSNTVLNTNFLNLKDTYYKEIVQFLKSKFPSDTKDLSESMMVNGRFIGAEYFSTMSKFYNYIKSSETFSNDLVRDLSNRLRGTIRAEKEELYKKMMLVLDTNSDFHRLVGNKYNNKKLVEMLNSLYTADHFSEYFRETKRVVDKLKLQDLLVGDLTVSLIIESIEGNELTTLDATNAYTSLMHFDELLLELHGNSFSIMPGLEGIEMGDANKYLYHQDTAHEKKSWQQSEAIDSEKYIANLTRRVLNQIRIFDYKTDSYKNRRVDSTAYIVAARNLLNDITYNNIAWTGIPTDFNSPRRKQFDDFINLAISIHSNPESKFLKVLEYLFDKVDGNSQEFYKNIGSRKLLTDYDLDILYSVYNAVYSKQNPSSLISQELKNLKGVNGVVLNLVLEISGFVDRNTTMDYLETSYDFESGLVAVKVKKKFFNNRLLYKTRVSINSAVNGVTLDKAQQLKNKYNFQSLPAINGNVYYLATINGELVTLRVPDMGGKILSNSDRISFEDVSIFNTVDLVDLVDFREKVLMGDALSEPELALYEMLGFIDDHLGLNILGNPSFGLLVLQTYKTIYSPKPEKILGKNFMMPMVLLAMRAAYANSRYAEAEGQPLGLYLESLGSTDDGIYSMFRGTKNSKLFSSKYGNIKYTIASFNDEVLNLWTDALSMLTGEASKATTKDKEGNSIPNNSVNKLGSILHHYLMKLENGNTSSLLFVLNKSLIKSTFHDLEVTTWNNDTKSVKAFSGGELFFHSIFNKFWGNYLNTGNVIILPTTYSDKTTFINYEINTRLDGVEDIMKSSNYPEEVVQQYMNTLGAMYSNVWTSTKNKLQQIAAVYNTDNGTSLNFRLVLNNLSEDLLNNLAKRANVDLELDKDYRIIKVNGKSVTSVNEELEYYATQLYVNKGVLQKALNKEKINFVLNLIDSNSSFLVIDYGDSVDNYLEDKISPKATSKNTIINTIKETFKDNVDVRKAFFKNWVDEKTGKLILAKLENSNILGIGNNFDNTQLVELNPLLDKFFYIEGLLSNNLRMSLTGSEINHPNKAKKTLYTEAKDGNFKTLGITNESDIAELQSILNTTSSVGDLNVEFFANLGNVSPNILKALHTIYDNSLLLIVNVSLGTLFKRNVIIPATLQYCLLNVRDGVAARIKCAVLRDESAEVWNYRGDHEDSIDSADGSAQINPFLSILENKSLGSLAVGFIKKPIWHAYDVESGTAFLAKFATDTITNEAMRMSSGSHTKLFNLFKKMTNLLWEGDVDLTESIVFGKIGGDTSRVSDLNKWFQIAILGNTIIPNAQGFDTYIKENRLIYKDSYGDKIEIVGFDKTVSEGLNLYYTKETTFTEATMENPLVNKVYHVFYNDNGNVSKHITFDSYLKAKSFIASTPGAHTINSLFELHTALGGINCVTTKGIDSEFTNEVVVNFMNTVGRLNPGFDLKRDIINLETYDLPLKKYHIGYALNNTAVKNGAKNMNLSKSWYDDSDLNYFEVDSDGLGMLMNADHDIIDSLLTEFSQVITATSAYGYTHDQCNEIFQGLASAALLASKKTLDAVNNFIELNFEEGDTVTAQSDLYDAIGRIIFTNQSIKDKESLQGVIMEAVNRVFYKSKRHADDTFKIPFSDANIYSDFISTLASTINKDSIKRKHPGSGCVMVPAYNMLLYFEMGGNKLLTTDIINLAREDYKTELLNILKTLPNYSEEFNAIVEGEEVHYLNNLPIKYLLELLNLFKIENTSTYNYVPVEGNIFKPDTTEVNNFLIKKYLEKNQLQVPIHQDNSWFMPSDIVDILGTNGEVLNTIDLDSLDKYYKFKDGIFDTELANNVRVEVDYGKDKYKISLNEDPLSLFIIEGEEGTGKYNIHFKTGGFDLALQRRTVSNLSEEQKVRLFKSALEVLPQNAILRLSPSTAELIETGIGGLTAGSIAGYNSIINNSSRTEGINIVLTSNTYSVVYTDKNGILLTAVVAEYQKLGQQPKGYQYRENIIRPHNLRPSLIRWKYKLNEESPELFMNIFDTPVIKNAYTRPNQKSTDYRKLIQKTLHDLTLGVFTDRDGQLRTVLAGSLENTAAELIMSNIYKEKFGIEGESLNEILQKGEDFFKKKYSKLNAPTNTLYDIAFVRDNGNHTLIKLGNVTPSGYVKELPFDMGSLSTNEKDEIVLMKGNRELFEIGRWIDNSDKVTYLNGIFVDLSGKAMQNLNYYRLRNAADLTSVLKRVDYLTKYLVTDKIVGKSGKITYKTNTLYKVANLKDFVEVLGNESDAAKQRSSIVRKIFLADNYKLAQINTNISWNEKNFNHVRSALGSLLSNFYVHLDIKNLLASQIDSIQTTEVSFNPSLDLEAEVVRKEELKKVRLLNLARYKELLKEFLNNEAHKKWISFLDSTNYIVSRIPAQTLLSFMTMKLIAWTQNSKNMAYVSHFLTYLLGSDYDIDKAYVMGLSYDDNATYIGWSNLFDFTTLNTLLVSKSIPIPKKIKISNDISGISLDLEINLLFLLTDENIKPLSDLEVDRVLILTLLSDIIRKAESRKGKLNYSDNLNPKFELLLLILNNHEFYPIPTNIAESAFKNVASANIYAVAHDIRNRDLAYTAISMGILLKAAAKSPKGNTAGKLNMFNPLTKYVMQYQNLVGKNVISIAANGEKVWFNAYYYWHQLLKNGNEMERYRLKFRQTLNRIEGRADKNIVSKTVTHLPDLNVVDEQIRNILLSEFEATPESMEYKYVDLLISQLLSAATDNAKELILAKINSGTNFARMYVYAMMTGFNINDIVAFMTSPAAEFIDLMSAPNIFLNDSIGNNATSAINMANGIIGVNKFLHGSINVATEDTDTGESYTTTYPKNRYVFKLLLRIDDNIYLSMKNALNLEGEEDFAGLGLAMLGLIVTAVENPKYSSLDIRELISSSDSEVNSYLEYCLDIIEKLRVVHDKYGNSADFEADIKEFKKLYELSSEISVISSAWLGLNLGLPTDELSLLKRMMGMSKIVSNRELALGIKDSDLYEKSNAAIALDEEEDSSWEEVETTRKRVSKNPEKLEANKLKLISRLMENNPTLIDVEERLDAAHDAGIINNFNIVEYLKNSEYRLLVKDYYGLIMGTLNVFDMMEVIPHYKQIMECFKALIVSKDAMASKSRLVNRLIAANNVSSVSDALLNGIIRYVDKLNTVTFTKGLPPIAPKSTIEGFNPYFLNVTTNKIELDTLEGLATFKHWIENEFKSWLTDESKRSTSSLYNNGAIKHLTIIPDNDGTLLSMDVDLLNPNVTTVSREGYDEILRGMTDLEKVLYDQDYTVADLLQLYNLVVNNNKYGGERLTTAFKVCTSPLNILNLYLNNISLQDYDINTLLSYDYIDYLINAAPIISTSAERFHTEKFVKVNDPVRGYILKKLGADNQYREYDVIPPVIGQETNEDKLRRLENFATNSSIEMPHSHNSQHLVKVIDFEGDYNTMSETDLKALRTDIDNLLKQFSTSNKLMIFKDC